MNDNIPNDQQGTEKLRILILEDVPRDADLVQRELQRAGISGEYRVLDSREEFIRALDEFHPHIILSDYNMPQFNGLEALEINKEHAPGIPFIIVTGSQNEVIAVSCMKAGSDDYVLKEQLHRLPQVVQKALEKKSLEKAEREAQEALKKAAQEWINTFDAVRDSVALLDSEGKVQRCNRAMQGLLHLPYREILGLTLPELLGVSPDELERYLRQWAQASSHTESQVIEFRQRWFRVYVDPVLDQGKAAGFVYIMHDITEGLQAEKALRESEERFRLLVEQAPEAIAVFDVDENRFIQANAEAEKLFECSREDLLKSGPQHFYAAIQSDGLSVDDTLRENIAAVLAGQAKTIERIIHNTNGREKICEVRLVILPDKDRRLIRNSFIDITERKRSEEALRASEAQYRHLYESMADAYVMVDMEGRIVEYNEAYKTMLGYEDGELVSMTYQDLTPEKWHTIEDAIIEKEVLKRGVTSIYEKEYRRKDGTVFPVELRSFLLKAEKGEPTHMCAIVRDTTNRRKMEEERENLQAQFLQAQKMESVGRLAGGMAHDFNNMLSVINGYAELGLDKLEEGHPLQADLQEIRQAGGRAAGLIRQLLAFSRKQVLSPEVLNLNEVVGNVKKMLRRLIREDLELIMDLAEDLDPVKADIGQIEQVIMNLAVNAQDAMPGGGKLTIGTRNLSLDPAQAVQHPGLGPGPYVLLTVSDTGTGMDRETQNQIFEPFFTTKEQSLGTGLGLSTVYGIVKQSGGDIQVYSEPGLGSTFKIYLPRVGEVEKETPEFEPSKTLSKGNETVLVVEDDEALRSLVREFLESVGYRVFTAADGEQGQLMAEQLQGPIHLLLTDVVMPKRNGLELANQLRGLFPELKVLFMSGYADNALIKPDWLGQSARFISKPFERTTLLEQIRKMLD